MRRHCTAAASKNAIWVEPRSHCSDGPRRPLLTRSSKPGRRHNALHCASNKKQTLGTHCPLARSQHPVSATLRYTSHFGTLTTSTSLNSKRSDPEKHKGVLVKSICKPKTQHQWDEHTQNNGMQKRRQQTPPHRSPYLTFRHPRSFLDSTEPLTSR